MHGFDKTFTKNEVTKRPYPNYWDVLALFLGFGVVILLAWGAKQMTAGYQLGQTITISLNPQDLPYYALRSFLRLLIAMLFSLVFTFIFGTLAAKSKHAARIIIPLIDILQSVPVLSFLSITVLGFVVLFQGSILGVECAAIFAVFTSQVWNMTLSFYQSIRLVPTDLIEASDMFQLSGWQRFWKIEVPFAMPGLLWNIMLSMSVSWFFVVASEAISIANQQITLPGIGSYIFTAINQKSMLSVSYAILAMVIVIMLYDQLLFRPLNQWANKFKFEEDEDEKITRSWVIKLYRRTRLLQKLQSGVDTLCDLWINMPLFRRKQLPTDNEYGHTIGKGLLFLWNTTLVLLVMFAAYLLLRFIILSVAFDQVKHVFYLGAVTGLRVMVLILLSSVIWVPVGVWVGTRPRVMGVIQPIVQILAAFPANLFFPIVVIAIVKYQLNPNVWISPLMVLGTQWYILFNVIAGASLLPKELRQVASTFNVVGWLRWKRIILPGIFPYFITGVITAAGGAWNASIVAELATWGTVKIQAVGLGAFIAAHYNVGDFTQVALGTVMMSLYVLSINHFIWKPLYRVSAERFRI